MATKLKLSIDEEYGYRLWVAYLTEAEYADLVRRWKTMKGLNCLVPVRLVVPQATPAVAFADINVHELARQKAMRCHVHECDDSCLTGVLFEIPPADAFEMDGRVYSREEIDQLRQDESLYYRAAREEAMIALPDGDPCKHADDEWGD